ncbi:trans-sialidase [Trypanosoma cruzi]|nr:trans-sialidase [Trypanosoma cruzi]
MHSHSHVLNGACCCFSEAGSVCQRDRGTRLAVAGVLSGTALECRVPRVGRSPRWGWRSEIAPRLLLNAVLVVDGKSLMGGQVRVCCRVISLGGTRRSDACVFALRMWCFDPYFTLFGGAAVDAEVMLSRAARAWWKRLREPVEDPSKSKCTMRFGSTGREETVGG